MPDPTPPPTPAPTIPAPTPDTTPAPAAGGGREVIIGAVVGAGGAAVLCVLLACVLHRRRRKADPIPPTLRSALALHASAQGEFGLSGEELDAALEVGWDRAASPSTPEGAQCLETQRLLDASCAIARLRQQLRDDPRCTPQQPPLRAAAPRGVIRAIFVRCCAAEPPPDVEWPLLLRALYAIAASAPGGREEMLTLRCMLDAATRSCGNGKDDRLDPTAASVRDAALTTISEAAAWSFAGQTARTKTVTPPTSHTTITPPGSDAGGSNARLAGVPALRSPTPLFAGAGDLPDTPTGHEPIPRS